MPRRKPERVRVLLMGEAPPAADDRYFYFEDVPSHDWLFLGVAEVVLGRKPARWEKATALATFREIGVFLIDLKLDPVDGSPLQSYVPDLVARCRALNPERIILIKATVFDGARWRPSRVSDSWAPRQNGRALGAIYSL